MSTNTKEQNFQEAGIGFIRHLNLFSAFPAAWILSMYYFGINAILNIILHLEPKVKLEISQSILEYNNIIMSYFMEYEFTGIFLGLSLILCGVAFGIIQKLPILKSYKIINNYSDYGLFAGGWLLGLSVTYYIYKNWGIIVLIAPIIVFSTIHIFKKFDDFLYEQFDITFRNRDDLL